MQRCVLPALEPVRKSHPQVFEDFRPRTTMPFKWPTDGSYLFPAQTKKAKQPWMARQTVWQALSHVGKVMFALTGRRRWNARFKGSHVTVHGATRHTSSALLLSSPKGAKRPAKNVIMEIQQRHDVATFRRYYCHAPDEDVAEALENASIPVCFATPSEDPGPTTPTKKNPEPMSPVHRPLSTATVPTLHPPAATTDAAASAEMPSSQEAGRSHSSRNAWRKSKRRAAKQAWQTAQAVSPDQPKELIH